MRTSRHGTSPRWPFWLLLVAWWCANSPQAATYAVLTWLADARQFSHQQKLTQAVAHLLVGEKPAARTAAVPAQSDASRPAAPLASVPAAAVLKKIDLSAERGSGVPPPAVADVRWGMARLLRDDEVCAPPPHGPPRVKNVS